MSVVTPIKGRLCRRGAAAAGGGRGEVEKVVLGGLFGKWQRVSVVEIRRRHVALLRPVIVVGAYRRWSRRKRRGSRGKTRRQSRWQAGEYKGEFVNRPRDRLGCGRIHRGSLPSVNEVGNRKNVDGIEREFIVGSQCRLLRRSGKRDAGRWGLSVHQMQGMPLFSQQGKWKGRAFVSSRCQALLATPDAPPTLNSGLNSVDHSMRSTSNHCPCRKNCLLFIHQPCTNLPDHRDQLPAL